MKNEQSVKVVLSLKGVGWRGYLATPEGIGEIVVLIVGASHPITVAVPKGVKVAFIGSGSENSGTSGTKGNLGAAESAGSQEGTVIEVSGSGSSQSSQAVGDFATRLRNVRPMNAYTGHGIIKRYSVDQGSVRVPSQRARKVGKRK